MAISASCGPTRFTTAQGNRTPIDREPPLLLRITWGIIGRVAGVVRRRALLIGMFVRGSVFPCSAPATRPHSGTDGNDQRHRGNQAPDAPSGTIAKISVVIAVDHRCWVGRRHALVEKPVTGRWTGR